MDDLKLGLVGLDTSHCIAFAGLLNDPGKEWHVPGGRIVAAYPGGSPDFHLSWSRVGRFTIDLRDTFGVEILDSPAEVAQEVDAVLLTSADGRVHLDQFRQMASHRRPTFIDKPLAVTSADARAIYALAAENGIPVMSCSSLRYAQPLVDTLATLERATIVGADCSGPMPLEETQPGLFWYGIHAVEMLYAILGRGCRQVSAATTPDHELVTGVWEDGRIGTVRGYRNASSSFGATIHLKDGIRFVDAYNHPRPAYAGMLEQALEVFRTGSAPIEAQETIEMVRFMEAANESRSTGRPVDL